MMSPGGCRGSLGRWGRGGWPRASLAFPPNIGGQNKCGQVAVEDLGAVGPCCPCPPSGDPLLAPCLELPLHVPSASASLPVDTVACGLPHADAPTAWGGLQGWGLAWFCPWGLGPWPSRIPESLLIFSGSPGPGQVQVSVGGVGGGKCREHVASARDRVTVMVGPSACGGCWARQSWLEDLMRRGRLGATARRPGTAMS